VHKGPSVLKVGCGKFIRGGGSVQDLADEIVRLGGKALVIGGPSSVDAVLAQTESRIRRAGVLAHICKHTGECSRSWADKYAQTAREQRSTVIVAVGGGKCIDLAKCVSVFANLPIITVPTSIATCAASSAVCIMYTDDGRPDGAVAMDKEVDVVIADTDLIATAPKRLLAAGIFDSLAKLPEVVHNKLIRTYRDCSLEQYISTVNAKAIYEFLLAEGRNSYALGIRSERFEDTILTNLLHTSVVSGFSAGSHQLAMAHGLYDFMRKHFTKTSASFLHGEIVAVGILMQLTFNRADPAHIAEFGSLMKDMEVPITLGEIGFDGAGKSKNALVDYLVAGTNIDIGKDKELLMKSIAAVS